MDLAPEPADHATRQISASFYSDQSLTRRFLDVLGQDPHRFIVRHDDWDGAAIAGHAARSLGMWRRHNLLVLAGALFPTLWAVGATDRGSMAIPGLILLAVNFWLLGRISSLLGRRRGLMAWLVIGLSILFVMSRISGALPSIRPFQGLSDLPTFLLFFPIFPAVLVDLVQRLWIQGVKLRTFRPGAWDPRPPPVSNPTIAAVVTALGGPGPDGPAGAAEATSPGRRPPTPRIDDPPSPNTTVYSGFAPFVGTGFERSRWSRALELRPVATDRNGPTPTTEPEPVNERDLNAAVLRHLQSLDLTRTTIRRWHFVEGTKAPQVPGLVPEPLTRPTGWVDPRLVVEGIVSDEIIRPYLWISSSRWSGGLILNSFIRVSPHHHTLFVEVVHNVVAALPRDRHRCDRDLDLHLASTWRTLVGESTQAVTELIGNLAWDLTRGLRWRQARNHTRRRHQDGLPVDYGATASLRDLFTDPGYDRYFQQIDADEFATTIDLHLLTALDRALRATGRRIARYDAVVESLAGRTAGTDGRGSGPVGGPTAPGLQTDRHRGAGQNPIAVESGDGEP